MKRVYSVIGLIAILGLVAMSTVSCKKAAGGGWVGVYIDFSVPSYPTTSTESLGKATFGFTARCEDVEDAEDGKRYVLLPLQLQYHDHYNKVKFHGVGVEDNIEGTCAELGAGLADNDFLLAGTYMPQPKGRYDEETDGGQFLLYVFDGGEPGFSEGDEFGIILKGGIFDGYINGGSYWGNDPIELLGGNIQVFED